MKSMYIVIFLHDFNEGATVRANIMQFVCCVIKLKWRVIEDDRVLTECVTYSTVTVGITILSHFMVFEIRSIGTNARNVCVVVETRREDR